MSSFGLNRESIRDRLSRLSREQTVPSIYKVPQQLINFNYKAYEPEIIAIGPYDYHRRHNLKVMEEHKVRYLESFIRRKTKKFGDNVTVDNYIEAVAKMEHVARDSYAEPFGLESAEFIEMLVLDGCFIIELLLKFDSRDSTNNNDPIFQTAWIINSLQRDLMLLENQIPFIVLSNLFDLIEAPNNQETLVNLILRFFQNLYPGAGYGKRMNTNSNDVMHLLDLIHKNWIPSSDVYSEVESDPIERGESSIQSTIELNPKEEEESSIQSARGESSIQSTIELNPMEEGESSIQSAAELTEAKPIERGESSIQCATELAKADPMERGKQTVRSETEATTELTEVDPIEKGKQSTHSTTELAEVNPIEKGKISIHSATEHTGAVPLKRGFRSIFSATELTNANVSFQKKEHGSLFEVDFQNGIMSLPPLTIGDRTECFFRNLIAFEQYFPNNRRTFVTDYVRLMDCLINSARDVEILSQCGIIDNWLGDNKVVANIFNRLTDSVTCPANHFLYAETFCLINNHYVKPWNKSRAVLYRDYLNSPWAVISIFAALVLFVFALVQTVFSGIQAF